MKIKELRAALGFSQEGMAKDLGVSLSYYEKIERGVRTPSAAFIRKVKAQYPAYSMDELFFAKAEKDA